MFIDPLPWWSGWPGPLLCRGGSTGYQRFLSGRPLAGSAAHRPWSSKAFLPCTPAGLGVQISLRCVAFGLQYSWGLWTAWFSWIHLCLPLAPGGHYYDFPSSFSSTFCEKDTHAHTQHSSLSLTHTRIQTHATRGLLIYEPVHFLFGFQMLYVRFSYRCGTWRYIMHVYLYSTSLLCLSLESLN